jgi:hypothetical protein
VEVGHELAARCISSPKHRKVLDPSGLAARSKPPGPLGASPDSPALPSGPSDASCIPFVPRALRFLWCLSRSPRVSSGAPGVSRVLQQCNINNAAVVVVID